MDNLFYDLLSLLCIVSGYSASVLMYRNAWRWRGRKLVLRLLSGTTCFYAASCFLFLQIAVLPDERVIASVLLRPAWFMMLTLAAAFSIADY